MFGFSDWIVNFSGTLLWRVGEAKKSLFESENQGDIILATICRNRRRMNAFLSVSNGAVILVICARPIAIDSRFVFRPIVKSLPQIRCELEANQVARTTARSSRRSEINSTFFPPRVWRALIDDEHSRGSTFFAQQSHIRLQQKPGRNLFYDSASLPPVLELSLAHEIGLVPWPVAATKCGRFSMTLSKKWTVLRYSCRSGTKKVASNLNHTVFHNLRN